ncbi:MAG: hypothetical protein AAFP89_20060 [Bacteroidota bacterium]
MKRKFFSHLCLLLVSLPLFSFAQPVSISGVVNLYSHVSQVDYANNLVTVDQTTGFQPDDQVLLIQMRGASINSVNASTFGNVTSLGGAGSFELLTICDVQTSSNQVTFQEDLSQPFSTTNLDSAGIQLVRVPRYQDARVDGDLTAPAWDGETGGVLILEVLDSLILDSDLDVSELGFRGGAANGVQPGCFFLDNWNDYYYPASDGRGGGKGEGIASYINGREWGRGAQANGGGGGNDHNAGGAGGSNYSAGGSGGIRSTGNFNCKGNNVGIAGRTLNTLGYSTSNSYVFMGGGGGAGHANGGETTPGGRGGGIVIIRASTLVSTGVEIRANGGDAVNSGSDGGSGGGAGGAVILQVGTYSGVIDILAQGGDGGNTAISQCQGPGGGGAGGVVWSSGILPGTINVQTDGGSAGIAAAGGCGNSTQGANNGSSGVELTGLTLNQGGGIICVLPFELTSFEGSALQNQVELAWTFTAQSSGDKVNLWKIQESGTSSLLETFAFDRRAYKWRDPFPQAGTNLYQLEMIDIDGKRTYSPILEVQVSDFYGPWVSANAQGDDIRMRFASTISGEVMCALWDLRGRRVHQEKVFVDKGSRELVRLGAADLPTGLYILRVLHEGRMWQTKVRVDQ